MPFSKTILADAFVQRLIENQGIYSNANRSFDSLVKPGATSVDIPALAIPVLKTAGVSVSSSDRKKTKTDTANINVPLGPYAVPLADELLGRYESGGILLNGYLDSAAAVIQEGFDTALITECQKTTDKADFAASTLSWADIVGINAAFDKNKVPKAYRCIVIDADLESEFFNIDVIKNAAAYNTINFATGSVISILGLKFFFTGVAPKVGTKASVTAFYGPGVAFILSRLGEIKTAWQTDALLDTVDVLAHAGAKLLDNKFAIVRTKPST